MKLRLLGWSVMLLVLAGAFAVGLDRDGGPRTLEERARGIAETISCPVCDGQSVAESDVSTAHIIRGFILEMVEEGRSDDEVRAEVDRRYPEENLLLTPDRSGVVGLVWVLPVVAVVLGLAGVGYAFYRWRRDGPGEARASKADRALVSEALAGMKVADRGDDDRGDGDREGA